MLLKRHRIHGHLKPELYQKDNPSHSSSSYHLLCLNPQSVHYTMFCRWYGLKTNLTEKEGANFCLPTTSSQPRCAYIHSDFASTE